MLDTSTRLGGSHITRRLATLDRRTTWTLVDERPLRSDAHHPQGMVRVEGIWWVSTVDIERRRGWVLGIDGDGDEVERVAVGDDVRYHPGGLDFDGSALWVAAAEYRPSSTASISRLVPGEMPEHAFDVADHVGAVARCGADGDLVGWSWGSRRFFRWSIDGRLVRTEENPSFFVDHQDCQWLASGHLLCGGVAAVSLAHGPGWLGGIGLLDVSDLRMVREVPFPLYPTPSGRVGTHNPISAEVVGDDLILHLLPDDGAGVILSYSTPLDGVTEQATES